MSATLVGRPRRMPRRATAFIAGTVLTGVTVFGGVAAASPRPIAAAGQVSYDVALASSVDAMAAAATSGWNDFWKFMLDWVFWIGQKTLPELVTNPWTGTSASVGEVLGWFNASTDEQLITLFHQLGLQNQTLAGILAHSGLTEGATVDEALQHWGLADVTLDQMMRGVGIGASTTMVGLLNKLGLGNETLSQLISQVGISTSTSTMGDLLGKLGLYGLQGFLPFFGLQHTSTIDDALLGLGINGEQTLGQFLGSGGFGSFIGSLTVGKALGFTDATTLQDLVESLNYTVDKTTITLGDATLDQVLSQLQLDPNQPLDQLLAGLQIGPNATDTLGEQTIAQAMDWLLNVGQTAVPAPGVVDSTQIGDYLIGIGLGHLTLDQWLGLDPVP